VVQLNDSRLWTSALVIVLSSVMPVAAQGVEGTRSVSVAIGTGMGLSGNAIEEAVGTINNTPSVFVEQSIGNHFSNAMRLRFTGSYGLDYNKEVFATFAYGRFNGTERIVGSVGGYPLYTRLSNADAFDIEGGLRYYFLPEGPTRTYAAGVLGLRFLQATEVTFRVRELNLELASLPYWDTSTLFIFGGDAGISRDLSDVVAIGAEVGLRYQPKPQAADLFADPNLQGVNDTGSRWSIPISAFVAVRF
jgi:hypothetical protein